MLILNRFHFILLCRPSERRAPMQLTCVCVVCHFSRARRVLFGFWFAFTGLACVGVSLRARAHALSVLNLSINENRRLSGISTIHHLCLLFFRCLYCWRCRRRRHRCRRTNLSKSFPSFRSQKNISTIASTTTLFSITRFDACAVHIA